MIYHFSFHLLVTLNLYLYQFGLVVVAIFHRMNRQLTSAEGSSREPRDESVKSRLRIIGVCARVERRMVHCIWLPITTVIWQHVHPDKIANRYTLQRVQRSNAVGRLSGSRITGRRHTRNHAELG